MFAGRKKELDYLNKKYESQQSELVVLYGRRRIGKTELLKYFAKDKNHIFYTAIETLDKNQLDLFSKVILKGRALEKYLSTFSTWEEAFSFLSEQAETERMLLVIDEFPYMVNGNASIPSILQNLWDPNLKHSKLMIILCGSAMAFMEKELLSVKNPLYGRQTGNYRLDEFSVFEVAELLDELEFKDVVDYYGVFGGIPHYLVQIDQKKSFYDNLKRIALERGSILFNEVELLLRQEVREVMAYYTVIQAIALGSTTINEIEQKSMIERTKLTYYLNALIDLGLIQKEYPVTMPIKQIANSRRGLYYLKDSFFRFYFTYMFPYMSELVESGCDHIIDHVIKPDINRFMGMVFEKISIQYLIKQKGDGQLPFHFLSIGRWWEKGEEIDIVAFDSEKNYLMCECKWTYSPVGLNLIHKLEHLSVQVTPDAQCVWYFVFSKSGFDAELVKRVKTEPNIVLISLKDMVL